MSVSVNPFTASLKVLYQLARAVVFELIGPFGRCEAGPARDKEFVGDSAKLGLLVFPFVVSESAGC